MSWQTKRKEPYTAIGINRMKCIRCGDKAVFQWQICSDGNNYRPLCGPCDVALNKLVLEWMGHHDKKRLLAKYKAEKLG